MASLRALAGPRNRRIAIGLSDQAVSSCSNFLVSIFAARALNVEGFGAFSIGFIVYVLALGVTRSSISEPYLVMRSGDATQGHGSDYFTLTLVVSGGLSVVVAIAGLLVGGSTRDALLVLALLLPAMLLQDHLRFVFVAALSPLRALGADLIWLVGLAILLPSLNAVVGLTAASAVLCWGLAAAASTMWAVAVLRIRPTSIRSSLQARAEWGYLSWRFFAEFLTITGATQLTVLILGWVEGSELVGALRGGQVLYGPLTVLSGGLLLMISAEGRTLGRQGSFAHQRNLSIVGSFAGFLVAIGWMVVLAGFGATLGPLLIGDTWEVAQDLVIPLGIGLAATIATVGAVAGIRALGDARRSLRTRLSAMPLTATGTLVGGLTSGAFGLAVGMTIGTALAFFVWWASYSRGLALRRRSQSHAPPPDRYDPVDSGRPDDDQSH